MNPIPRVDNPPHSPRLFFLDWLRIIALALLLPYHVGMYYVSWPWHVKSVHAGPLIEPLLRLTSPWRMSLLFLIAGAATALVLQQRPPSGAWLRQRAARLLLPLLAGLLLVVPPQAYFEAVQRFGYGGGWFDFLPLYFSGDSRFCDARGCLILPTWNHLWFLPYLFVYTLILWAVQRWWPQRLDGAAARLPQTLAGARLWLLPLGWLLLTQALLRPLFPVTHALVDDLFTHSQHAATFMLGALLARNGALWPRFVAWRWPALGLALLAWALLLALQPAAPRLPRALLLSVQQWAALVAVIGWACQRLNHDGAARRVLTEAVFPVYVLHQTVTIGAAMALAPLALPAALEGGLLLLLTLAGAVLGWLILRRLRLLRPWFGIADSTPGANCPDLLTEVRSWRRRDRLTRLQADLNIKR